MKLYKAYKYPFLEDMKIGEPHIWGNIKDRNSIGAIASKKGYKVSRNKRLTETGETVLLVVRTA